MKSDCVKAKYRRSARGGFLSLVSGLFTLLAGLLGLFLKDVGLIFHGIGGRSIIRDVRLVFHGLGLIFHHVRLILGSIFDGVFLFGITSPKGKNTGNRKTFDYDFHVRTSCYRQSGLG